jgi:hypothetical protein
VRGGARRRRAKDGLPATNSYGKNTRRKRRGRGTYLGVGGEKEALETVAQRRGRAAATVLRGGGSVEREERKGGAWGGEEVLMPLYRVEEEGETTR